QRGAFVWLARIGRGADAAKLEERDCGEHEAGEGDDGGERAAGGNVEGERRHRARRKPHEEAGEHRHYRRRHPQFEPAQGAATVIFLSANALRRACAKRAAPGWSPCRQSVSAATGTRLPERLVT